jgi:catechol 2,3-dioxygenase-like lactoylglutathione lyase family enzyme
MTIREIFPQLRTTDLAASLRFWTDTVGLAVEFTYGDFYAGLRAGPAVFHLKRVDTPDPSIPFVAEGDHLHLYLHLDDARGMAERLAAKGVTLVKPLTDTPWGTRDFSIRDDQGHTIYFGETLPT